MEVGDRQHSTDTAIDELVELAARVRAGEPVQAAEVDRALRHGALALMGAQAGDRATIKGARTPAGGADVAGRSERVARLSRAMSELRELTRPPGTLTTWAEHGFVLPDRLRIPPA
jgi:hypothetical protein